MGQDVTYIDELGLEYSVHPVPVAYKDEIIAVFPTLSAEDLKRLHIVVTCQRSAVDMVKTGEKVEAEKDRCLKVFTTWAKTLCGSLVSEGHWSDYLDPCSGLPMIHRDSQTVYDEVSALTVLRGFRCDNAGCCKVVLHPEWGSFIYPATCFTMAPIDVLHNEIKAMGSKLLSKDEDHQVSEGDRSIAITS